MKKYFIILLFALTASVLYAERLTLDRCLASAKQNNCTIVSAMLDVQMSQQVKKQMFTKYFPQVNANAFAFYAIDPIVSLYIPDLMQSTVAKDAIKAILDALREDNPDISDNIEMLQWGAAANLSAVQPLYAGGRIVNANKLAKIGIEASQKKAEITLRDVLQEVEETYWLVTGLYEKRSTVQQARSLLDTIENVAQIAFDNGLVTRNDLLKVQLAQNELSSKTLQLEDGIVLASKMLCHISGIEYTPELELDSFPIDNDVEALVLIDTFIVNGRPEADLLNMNIKAEQLRKKITLGEALPQVGIALQGGYSNFFKRDRWNGVAFAFVRIPLTQWWETGHKIKEHNMRIEKARMMQTDLMAKMALQNEQTYDQLNEAVHLVAQSESAVELARENYRMSLMNYEAGISTMSELLEAQLLLLQSQNAYTDARISYRAAQRKFNDLNK